MSLFWALLLTVTLVISSVSFAINSIQNTAAVAGEAQAVAGSMCVYRNAVLSYLLANPGARGDVASAALTLPSWFRLIDGVHATIDPTGRAYVYFSRPLPKLADELRNLTHGGVPVGIAKGGTTLVDAYTGSLVTDQLPASIPTGSVVVVQYQ